MSVRIETRTLEVPAPTLWRLATIAEQRGIRVVDLLAEVSLTGTINRPGQPRIVLTNQQRVALLHAKGLRDHEIARQLGLRRATVYYHRRALDLAPNRARGDQ